MARRRYSAEQIIAALEPVKEPVELGLPVADLIRQMGITEQTNGGVKQIDIDLHFDQTASQDQNPALAFCRNAVRPKLGLDARRDRDFHELL